MKQIASIHPATWRRLAGEFAKSTLISTAAPNVHSEIHVRIVPNSDEGARSHFSRSVRDRA
jgi:hypothetical protein